MLACLAANFAVAVVLPLALLPVVLDVLHLGSLGSIARVSQSMLEATFAALAQAGNCQRNDCQDTSSCGTGVNSDVYTGGEFGPFLGQRLGSGFIELVLGSRVSAGRGGRS